MNARSWITIIIETMIDTTQIMCLLAKPPALNESMVHLTSYSYQCHEKANAKCEVLQLWTLWASFQEMPKSHTRSITHRPCVTRWMLFRQLNISPTFRLPCLVFQGLEVISMFEAEQSRQEKRKNTPLTVIKPYITLQTRHFLFFG